MNPDFLLRLSLARAEAGVPFVITSGWRCVVHNRVVGGVPTSDHPKGDAADIDVLNSEARYRIVRALMLAGFSRIGIYKNYIHVDANLEKVQEVLWLYE